MAFVNERKRFWIVVAALLVGSVAIGYRLVAVHLKLVDLDIRAPSYWFTREIQGIRGGIYTDAGGRQPFARSVPVWEYHVDPRALNLKPANSRQKPHTREGVVKTVAAALKMDEKKVRDAFWRVDSRYVYLATSYDTAAYGVMTNSSIVSGVIIDDKQVRRYPQGKLLAHVLGFVSKDPDNPVGAGGIEMQYERYLKGVSGRVKGMRDARGREIRERRMVDVDPSPGADVYLTVDPGVQYEVEQALYEGFVNCRAKAGWSIVLDARKGSVLAMATYPTFEPEHYNKAGELTKKNRCISENYEPGSVMKTITACAVLNERMVSPDTMISTARNDPDYFKLPGDGSHKWEPFMSVRDALVHSSNIVYGKLGYRLGPSKLWKYFKAFGFGRKTGIDLPGEETGILPDWKKWDKASWSRAPIGQFVAVTPIQMAVAYGAVANGGKLMKPYIVDRVVSADGDVIFRNEPVEVGRPITAETARKVREMMLGVAKPGGTARRAAVKGYSVAGKTGTAQMKEGKGYSSMNYNASFIGIVPAADPAFVVLVTYQQPEHCSSFKYHEQTGLPLYNHQGGVCAAPVFSRIAATIARYLGVEPDKPEELATE